jgi:uncharacterized membrane protein YdjX (TVP38/TMEM64 family)
MSWIKLSIAAVVVALLGALAYHYRADVGPMVLKMEDWIADLGVWGPLVFTALFIVLTSFFFPDSLLSAVAGALFGAVVGMVVVLVGVAIAQCIAFGVSRHFLQDRIRQALSKQPKLAAIQGAADREGLRLLVLLRLAPLNPVLVSHVIGTTRIGFGVFLFACVGLIPSLFVEVYLGYAAKHMVKAASAVSEHSTAQTVLTVLGAGVMVFLLVYLTRMAQRALAEAEGAAA